jgi:hypothetical protein
MKRTAVSSEREARALLDTRADFHAASGLAVNQTKSVAVRLSASTSVYWTTLASRWPE